MLAFLKALAALAAVAGGALAVTNFGSVSAGMQPGPVCITQTAHPGNSYSAPVSVTGNGTLRLSVQQIGPPAGPPYPADGRPLPASWVSFTGTSQVTVSVPAGARPGRYGASLVVTNYGSGGGGSGTHVALGAAAATWLEVSVGVSPPPRAFCEGLRPTYWPSYPLPPLCKHNRPPLQGRQVVCRYLPLPPPVASAKNCGWSNGKYRRYIRQLELAGQRYAHNRNAYLGDAHCIVGGHTLNTASYNHRSGAYRSPGGGAPRFKRGQIQDARPAAGP